jgi:hypothetical protein
LPNTSTTTNLPLPRSKLETEGQRPPTTTNESQSTRWWFFWTPPPFATHQHPPTSLRDSLGVCLPCPTPQPPPTCPSLAPNSRRRAAPTYNHQRVAIDSLVVFLDPTAVRDPPTPPNESRRLVGGFSTLPLPNTSFATHQHDREKGLKRQCFFVFVFMYSTNTYLQICPKRWARSQKRAQTMVCHRLGPSYISLICMYII